MGVFTAGRDHGGPRAGRLLPGRSDRGLRAIIAIYSTALGPALGGTRFHPYASEEDALADALNLQPGDGLQERHWPGSTTAAARP